MSALRGLWVVPLLVMLGALSPARAAESTVEELWHSSRGYGKKATQAQEKLKAMGAQAVNPLLELATHVYEQELMDIMGFLGSTGDEGMRVLASRLDDPNPTVRFAALGSVAGLCFMSRLEPGEYRVGDRETVVAAMYKGFSDPLPEVRMEACVIADCLIPDPEKVPQVLSGLLVDASGPEHNWLGDYEDTVSRYASRAMVAYGAKALPVVIPLLHSDSPAQLACSAEVLGRAGEEGKKHLNDLLLLAHDDSPEVRAAAIRSLINLAGDDTRVIAVAQARLRDVNWGVSGSVRWALERHPELVVYFKSDLVRILRDESEHTWTRSEAAELLGMCRPASRDVLLALTWAMTEPDESVAHAAAKAALELSRAPKEPAQAPQGE